MALAATEPSIAQPYDTTDEPMLALYIGDDNGLADLYKLKLEMDGYVVTLAATGTEGLARLRQQVPDIMFLDLGPADQSLLEMLRKVRRKGDLEDVPAVLLWRGGTDEPTIQGLRLGPRDFLVRANGTHPDQVWPNVSDRLPFYLQ